MSAVRRPSAPRIGHRNRRDAPVPVRLTVNDQPVAADVAPQTLLVDFVRDHLHLTGTHQGCDTAQCGACTVLVDGQAVKSCNRLALQCAGRAITTIEGLAPGDAELHVMQAMFRKHHGLQCGFCTPGVRVAGGGHGRRGRRG